MVAEAYLRDACLHCGAAHGLHGRISIAGEGGVDVIVEWHPHCVCILPQVVSQPPDLMPGHVSCRDYSLVSVAG